MNPALRGEPHPDETLLRSKALAWLAGADRGLDRFTYCALSVFTGAPRFLQFLQHVIEREAAGLLPRRIVDIT